MADAQIMPPGALALVTRDWPDVVRWPPGRDGAGAAARGLRRRLGRRLGSDGDLTGAGVRDLADAVTAALRAHGVGIGDRVAILLPRGARLLPAILGVWSAGASYVPMDPVYPDQRLATMLADSGAAAIVIDSSALERRGSPLPRRRSRIGGPGDAGSGDARRRPTRSWTFRHLPPL